MTKIEWCHRPGTIPESWNPISGCSKISAGCKNCYAERMARRLAGRCGYPKMPHHFDVTLHANKLELPLHWRKPRTVFVCSMSDLFHPDVPMAFRDRVFSTMQVTPEHTYLILTKRPVEMHTYITASFRGELPGNVWLGVTIEKPEYSWRSEYLRQTLAAVRFISFEPLLASFGDHPGVLDDMDWVIAGGESGPGARPTHPDWAGGLRDQCQAEGIPFFFKQWGRFAPSSALHRPGIFFYADGHVAGEWDGGKHHKKTGADMCYMVPFGKKEAGRMLDGRTWDEFPEGGRRDGR